MASTISALITPRGRAAWLDDLKNGVRIQPKLAQSLAILIAGGALYGAVLGSWRGGAQILYAAIKLPLALILTAAITGLFHWFVALLSGLQVRFSQIMLLTFQTLAVAAVLLASLVPVLWLFTRSAPMPSPLAQTAHNLLYLLHTGAMASAGLMGTVTLWHALERLSDNRTTIRRVYGAWLLSFALVGGEVAWALRPFVGSIYYPTAFLRPDALEGNVYEFIVSDILPHLMNRYGGGQ